MKEVQNLKVVIVKPLLPPFVKEIDGSLESMQNIVGGTIQAIYPFDNPEVALICNDDGKLIGLPLNRALRDKSGDIYDIIVGTFFICSAPATSEEFESLTYDQIKFYIDMFNEIEVFIFNKKEK